MIIIIAQMITISHFKVLVTESLSFVRRQYGKTFPILIFIDKLLLYVKTKSGAEREFQAVKCVS